MQENGNLRPPKRPGYGTVGRLIELRANSFRTRISPRLSDLYHYDVEIEPNKCPRMVKRDVVNEIVMKYRSTVFQGHEPAFDGEKNLYSSIKLPAPVSESLGTLRSNDTTVMRTLLKSEFVFFQSLSQLFLPTHFVKSRRIPLELNSL